MSEVYELPVIDAPFQRFSTVLNSVPVAFTLKWNAWLGRWAMDIEVRDELAVAGLRLVPGADLVRNLGLGIGRLFLVDWAGRGGEPGRSELPSGEFRLCAVV